MNIIVGSGEGTTWIKYLLYNTIKRPDTYYATDESKLIASYGKRGLFCFVNHKKTKRLKKILKPVFINDLLSMVDESTNYMIFLNWNDCAFDAEYHRRIKQKNPNCKTILLLTATIHTSMKYISKLNITIDEVKSLFDIVCTYDFTEAQKYNLVHVPLMYNGLTTEETHIKYDVVYVGNAKDRLVLIHNLYKRLIDSNLRCCFYVSGVREDQKLFSGIIYNTPIPYEQVVKLSSESKCILEIIEQSQTFSTIRMGESILLNKKLITNNRLITEDECYDQRYMKYIECEDDLVSFIKEDISSKMHPKYDVLANRELINYLQRRGLL